MPSSALSPTRHQEPPALWHRVGLAAAIAVTMVSSYRFVLQTVLGTGSHHFDFHVIYAASRVWVNGGDPYNQQSVFACWDAINGNTQIGGIGYLWSIVAPTTFVLVSPFAFLPPALAGWAWLAFSVCSLALLVWCVLDLARISMGSWRAWALISFALLCSPVYSAIYHGQPALPAIALATGAVVCTKRGKLRLAGTLLGVAICWKVHVAVPFVVYAVLNRQWRPLKLASVVVLVISLLAVARLQYAGQVEWLVNWRHNLSAASTNGLPNDYAFGNGARADMLSVNVLAYGFLRSRLATDVFVLTFGVCLLLTLVLLYRSRQAKDSLLLLATISVWSLLPVYHRWPDATVSLLAVGWLAAPPPTSRRGTGRLLVLLSLALQLIPLPLAMSNGLLMLAKLRSTELAAQLWLTIVEPIQCWYTVILAVALLSACFMERHEESRVSAAAPA